MKSWDQLPQDWNHPDCIEYRTVYGPPVYSKIWAALKGHGSVEDHAKPDTFPERREPPIDLPKPP